jgi:hypothetical protein
MLLVVPVSPSDSHLIPYIERSFEMYPPGSGHQLLVVGAPNVYHEVTELNQSLCRHFAGNGKTLIFDNDTGMGWPTACNQYLQNVAFHLPTILGNEALWLWFELDSTPLKTGWMDRIEKACIEERAKAMRETKEPPKFFGVRETTRLEYRGELMPDSGFHMAPVGVYPADMANWILTIRTIHATNIPWYVFCRWYIAPQMAEIPLIQNNWKTNSYVREPDGKIVCKSEANWAWKVHFNNAIGKDVVLIHGCKDGSLTDLLRAEYEYLKAEGAPLIEYWTDFHEEPSEPAAPKAERKGKVNREQVNAARKRLLAMHEARRAEALK